MEKELFYYAIVIIIPTLVTLFSLANIIYLFGEFKENVLIVPKILIIHLIKLIFLSILQTHTFHYLFHNYIPKNFYFISVLINLYIIFEMVKSYKLINKYHNYIINMNKHLYQIRLNVPKFNIFILKETKQLYKKNLFFFTFIESLNIIIGIILIITVIFNFSIFNYLLLMIYACIFVTKRYMANFLSTL